MDADEIAADPGRSLLLPTADAVAQAFTAEGVVCLLYTSKLLESMKRVKSRLNPTLDIYGCLLYTSRCV